MNDLRRRAFSDEHIAFRDMVKRFIQSEITPNLADWENVGEVARAVWDSAGALGLLGLNIPREFGGGDADFTFNAILGEELVRAGAGSVTLPLTNDIVLPYLAEYATAEQKQRWLPDICAGRTIAAIAMSEPGAGSDLRAIRTTAVRDGDHYRLTGSKTFITNGILADVVIVAAVTPRADADPALSLLVVERDTPGFVRGKKLHKIGRHANDTAELFFEDALVPVSNLLGEEGRGLHYLMSNLPQERLSIALSAVAGAERALDLTVDYAKSRKAFGRSIGSFQANRFTLAEMATEVRIARVFVDEMVARHVGGSLDPAEAAMAKWWTTELENRIATQGLQLHGGYGYMREYPIAQAFLDARVQTIYGGTNEIMKEIIGRTLGL